MTKRKLNTRKRKKPVPFRKPRPPVAETHAERIERARQLIDSHTRKLQTGVRS